MTTAPLPTHLDQVLRPGMRIFVSGSVNEPLALLEQLAGAPANLEFLQFPIGGLNRTDFTAVTADARMTTVFMTQDLRGADPQRLQFLPMGMRQYYDFVGSGVDLALVQVARDRDGHLRAGPNVDFLGALLDSNALVAAQLNTAIVAPAGAPLVPPKRLCALVSAGHRLPELPSAQVDSAAARIGGLVAELVRDGDCLQTGIGAIPAAILGALGDKQDLGWHGGLVDDGVLQLIANGNLNGAAKTIDPGVHITGMALCSAAGHSALATMPQVQFRGADYTHDASVIRQLDNFLSVNSAVQVDLSGQVNAEVVGGRQISGTGGSVDFMRAAKLSRGGRSIVALNATARGGSVSRIVPRVDHVTALRTDVDMVVTEFGVADLRNAPLGARQEALSAIAAPEFREALAGA